MSSRQRRLPSRPAASPQIISPRRFASIRLPRDDARDAVRIYTREKDDDELDRVRRHLRPARPLSILRMIYAAPRRRRDPSRRPRTIRVFPAASPRPASAPATLPERVPVESFVLLLPRKHSHSDRACEPERILGVGASRELHGRAGLDVRAAEPISRAAREDVSQALALAVRLRLRSVVRQRRPRELARRRAPRRLARRRRLDVAAAVAGGRRRFERRRVVAGPPFADTIHRRDTFRGDYTFRGDSSRGPPRADTCGRARALSRGVRGRSRLYARCSAARQTPAKARSKARYTPGSDGHTGVSSCFS